MGVSSGGAGRARPLEVPPGVEPGWGSRCGLPGGSVVRGGRCGFTLGDCVQGGGCGFTRADCPPGATAGSSPVRIPLQGRRLGVHPWELASGLGRNPAIRSPHRHSRPGSSGARSCTDSPGQPGSAIRDRPLRRHPLRVAVRSRPKLSRQESAQTQSSRVSRGSVVQEHPGSTWLRHPESGAGQARPSAVIPARPCGVGPARPSEVVRGRPSPVGRSPVLCGGPGLGHLRWTGARSPAVGRGSAVSGGPELGRLR